MRAVIPTALGVLLLCATAMPRGDERIQALIITGANNHDWEWTSEALANMLTESKKFDVSVTKKPGEYLADAQNLARFQVFVLDYNGPRWGAEAEKNFLAAVRTGTGVSVIHAANNAFSGWREFEQMVCLCWLSGTTGHGSFHKFDVKITDADHPITRNLPDLKDHPDELYHRLVHMHGAKMRVIGSAHSSKESGGTGEDEPMILVSRFGQGRVFHTPLGHVWRGAENTRESHRDPQFQNLVVRGTEWAATGRVMGDPRGQNRLTAEERSAGFKLLFDGRSTRGWRAFKHDSFPASGWTVEDGALKVIGGTTGGDIITTRRYENFEMRFDFKVSLGANSGVIYAVSEEDATTYRTGPEFQIMDDGDSPPTAATSCGGLYALYSPQNKKLNPVGEWNSARISVVGGHIEHWLNGGKLLEADIGSEDWKQRVAVSKFSRMPRFGSVRKGHIALQEHGHDVWFRNLRIRELPSYAGAAQGAGE